MLYCVGIGLAFVVVGHALERVLHFAGRPTRWAWVIAMVGSYLVPVAAWIRPDAFATFAAPIPHVIQSPTGSATGTTSTLLQQPGSRPFSLSDLDLPLRWVWGIASVVMLLALVTAATRLVALRRHWRGPPRGGPGGFLSASASPAAAGGGGPRVRVPARGGPLHEGRGGLHA